MARTLQSRYADNRNVTIIEAAVSDSDGIATFFPGIDSDQSSTLLEGKRPSQTWRVDYSRGYRVRTVDFARWLQENTRRSDEIIVKMDIEGAEYSVLGHLIHQGLLRRLREIRVEWHFNRYPAISQADHERISSEVARQTKLVNWG